MSIDRGISLEVAKGLLSQTPVFRRPGKQGELIFRKGQACRGPVAEGITFVKDLLKVSLLRSLSLERRPKCLGLEPPFTLDEYYKRLLVISVDDVLTCVTS